MNTNLHVILSLFATSSRLQRKRAVLTVASIAWGTVAILLLLAFGEGLKRQMDKNRRSTGENIAVMWMGETSKPWKGMPPGRPVVFIGDEMAKDIFGDEKPIGKMLLINNAPYTVIGVMQHKTQMGMYGGPDANHAVIPISTFRAQFGRERLNNLLIETEQPE